jgi:hypothetical protein
MHSRTLIQVLTRATLFVCALFVVGVLLAAIPAHRPPVAQQQEPAQQASADPVKDDMAGMRHDQMSQKELTDEKSSEGNAVHDMMRGHHHMHGPHMKMTAPRPRTRTDEERAGQIVAQLHDGIEKYKDYTVALADGYKIFLPNVPQPEYHFTNYWHGFLQAFDFDASRPTSLLYRKTADGFELVGAMYTMPKTATPDQLNARIPLSVTSWHLHTNLCMPPQNTLRKADWTKFGLRGSISTQQACDTAGGLFRPSIFGWMVHVYPYENSLDKIFGQ